MLNASAISPRNAKRVTEKSKLETKKKNKSKSNDRFLVFQQRGGSWCCFTPAGCTRLQAEACTCFLLEVSLSNAAIFIASQNITVHSQIPAWGQVLDGPQSSGFQEQLHTIDCKTIWEPCTEISSIIWRAYTKACTLHRWAVFWAEECWTLVSQPPNGHPYSWWDEKDNSFPPKQHMSGLQSS